MSISINGKLVELDEDGFVKDPGVWSKDLAKALAEAQGINLTEDHWTVINYIRGYYKRHQAVPMIRKLCKETGYSLKQIYKLFPAGPAQGAVKIAGLPKPNGCV